AVILDEALQPGVNLGLGSATLQDRVKGFGGGRADLHASPVVGDDLHLENVVLGAGSGAVELREHRVHTTGVVPDHSSKGATAVRGRIGTEGQPMRAHECPEIVEHYTRLHSGPLFLDIDLEDSVHVLRVVEDH